MKSLFSILSLVVLMSCSPTTGGETSETATATTVAEVQTQKTKLNLEEFKAAMAEEGSIVVDVRTKEEVENGKIGDAMTIDYHDVDFAKKCIAALPRTEGKVLLYCAGGVRSGKAVKLLQEKGFTNVYDLDGGYGVWE